MYIGCMDSLGNRYPKAARNVMSCIAWALEIAEHPDESCFACWQMAKARVGELYDQKKILYFDVVVSTFICK